MNYNVILKKHLVNAIREIMINFRKSQNQCLYISFDPTYPEVSFPENVVKERFVTIVLQNRFWNLEIDDYGFGVVIEIEKKYKIYVPFESILMISDPINDISVDLVGIFSGNSEGQEENDEDEDENEEDSEEEQDEEENILFVNFQENN